MATEVARLRAVLDADTRQFDRAIRGSESRMSRFGKFARAGALAAGAGIAYGLGKVAKIGWDEFNQGQKVAAQTNAVLKSTGGVANVTAKDVERLGKALMLKSGVDDEVIKSGQNMLLTFKGIRNETGRGNDIFNQATKATLDLSVAMGKDMNDSAIMVGKALNDPIRGLTAMRRVGIQFTEAQEEQIKKMVESGDVMGAQKMILRELRSEFGGSAEAAGKTFGGQINILRERFNNWAGDMTAKAIPLLQRFGTFIMPLVEKAVRIVGDIIDTHVRPAVLAFVDTIRRNRGQLLQIWKNVTAVIQTMWKVAGPILRVLFTRVLPVVMKVAITWVRLYTTAFLKIIQTGERVINWFSGTFVPFIRRIWDAVRDHVTSRINRIRDVFGLLRNTAFFTWDFIRDKAMIVVNVVRDIIRWIGKLISKIQELASKATGPLGKVGGLFGGIKGIVRSGVEAVGDFGSFGLGRTNLVALGRQLQSMGFQVGEHPAFGGVAPVHVPGSYHYQGRALDINWPGGGAAEMGRLDWLYGRLQRMPGIKELLWRTAGHFDHLHVAMRQGGTILARKPTPVIMGEGGAEMARFWPLGRGPGGGITNILNIPPGAVVVDGEKLLRLLEQASQTSARRGGPSLGLGFS